MIDGGGLTESTIVVTSDAEMAADLQTRGVRVASEKRDDGVNSAVRTALRVLSARESFLVIPSDLPLLRVPEIRDVLEWGSREFIVAAPSRGFTGTNGLLFSRSDRLPLSYDRNSFWNHLRSAASKGSRVVVSTAKGLTFDIDTPEDLSLLAQSSSKSRSALFARQVLKEKVRSSLL